MNSREVLGNNTESDDKKYKFIFLLEFPQSGSKAMSVEERKKKRERTKVSNNNGQ